VPQLVAKQGECCELQSKCTKVHNAQLDESHKALLDHLMYVAQLVAKQGE
jgi:hypothetical protein